MFCLSHFLLFIEIIDFLRFVCVMPVTGSHFHPSCSQTCYRWMNRKRKETAGAPLYKSQTDRYWKYVYFDMYLVYRKQYTSDTHLPFVLPCIVRNISLLFPFGKKSLTTVGVLALRAVNMMQLVDGLYMAKRQQGTGRSPTHGIVIYGI